MTRVATRRSNFDKKLAIDKVKKEITEGFAANLQQKIALEKLEKEL